MAQGHYRTPFKKALLQFITEPDPFLAMLKWVMTEMMRIEAESKVGATKGKHTRERTTYFSGARARRVDTRMGNKVRRGEMNHNYGWQFIRRALAFVAVFILGVVSSFSAPDTAKAGERYLLKGNTPVHISVETGWKRQGLTPVQLDIQGLNLTLWMDGEGQVFDEAMSVSQGAEKTMSRGQALFRLDIMNGQMRTVAQTLTGEIYEQNPLRTRLRFSGLNAALDLDVPGSRAALDLNGLIIPVRLHLGPNADGVRELKIGDLGNRGEGHLFLDAGQGRLMWEDSRPGRVKEQTGRVCWAEKQR